MTFETYTFPSALAKVSCFKPDDGVAEHHLIITCTDTSLGYHDQLHAVEHALHHLKSLWPKAAVVFKRYFLSDPVNQAPEITHDTIASIVGQSPLSLTKVALWAYLIDEAQTVTSKDNTTIATHGQYTHIFTGYTGHQGEAYSQTLVLFDELCDVINRHGGTIRDNCMRTWIFVRDIDINYPQVVKARNDVFNMKGLTSDTHFIASTGIGAEMPCIDAKVRMDAYSLIGHSADQVKYLVAPDHLNPTIQYGVAFERGTAITYGDRRHVLISGTASINNKGEIINVGDVAAQGRRALENVKALLSEAGCGLQDIASAIVYLRDIADYGRACLLMQQLLPDTPLVIVSGPVCRPGWLIELECVAISPIADQKFAPL